MGSASCFVLRRQCSCLGSGLHLHRVLLRVLLFVIMPTPATSAQSHCTEAARAAALASHSAASLSAAAGFREAARLLRSSEALARAATAALLALPRSDTGAPTPGGDAPAGKKKKRRS